MNLWIYGFWICGSRHCITHMLYHAALTLRKAVVQCTDSTPIWVHCLAFAFALHTPPLLGGTLPENHSVEKENFAPHRFSNWCLCRMAPNLQHCNALSSSFTVDFHTFLQWMCPTRKICRSWTCPSFLQASMFIVCDPSQPGARPRPSRDGWWWFPTSTYHGLPSSILNNFHSLSSLSHFNLCLLDSNQFCLCQHTIETTGDTSY